MSHKGETTSIAFTAGNKGHAPKWDWLTDHWPIWSTNAIHSSEKIVANKAVPQKVRWELNLTDRQKVYEFVESMEKYDDIHTCPTDLSKMDTILEYKRNLERHHARKVNQLYRRAGQGKRQCSHIDG